MDKLIYALNLIVDFIDVNENITESALSDYLFFTGLDGGSVQQALSLLDMETSPKTDAFRVFSKSEKRFFTEDALNYINKLLIYGVLDIISIEEVIERASSSGVRIADIDTIKEITLIYLLEQRLGLSSLRMSDDYVQ